MDKQEFDWRLLTIVANELSIYGINYSLCKNE